jgi:molybdopterin-guanine dinucleotide biosynthesis protein A
MEPLNAFVLAGGKSARMGSDKAFLELGGQPLIARALAFARAISGEVRIVGDTGKFSSFGDVIEDIYPDRGPLGGIHAALSASDSDWNLILGVDLPFLTPAFLKFLVAEAGSSAAIVTVPFAGGYFHPLCAIYRKEFGVRAERALAVGSNRIDALFADVPTRQINEQELAAAGFNASIFRNLNTPEDWEKASRILAGLDL